jgi:DNA-binding winged helix-turn-helix (wHTH) protein
MLAGTFATPVAGVDATMQGTHIPAASGTGWRCGRFEIHPARRRLLRGGEPVEVEERVFDLIVLLAGQHDRALDRREVTTALWGSRPVSETTLRQVVYKARRAMDDDGQRQAVIRTLHGRSLRWVAPVEPLPSEAPAAVDATPRPVSARPRPAHGRPRWGLAGFAILLALATVGGALLLRRQASASHAMLRVAVAPVDNATGDPTLDWTRNGLPGLLSSLLDSGGGIDVVEPRAVAQAWDFRREADMPREAQLRRATGAGVVVLGRLRKLQAALYELDLHVEPASGEDADLRVTGERPGTLAADAVPRLRRALRLAPVPVPRDAPADPFVAEAYARGADAAARGRMEEARSYFEVCVRDAPASLPCAYGLGAAQLATRQPEAGEATLQRVLGDATRRHDDTFRVRALDELAYAGIMRHRFADARDLLLRATPALAHVAADVRVSHALRLADVQGRLRDLAAAEAALRQARELIAAHALRAREADLHNAEAIVAKARGDDAGSERAQRAALAASEAVGNERDAAGDAYNLALALSRRGERDQALPLLARAWVAARGKDAWLEFGAGDNLAIGLLAGGLDRRAQALVEELGGLAAHADNRSWQALDGLLDGAIALYRDDPARAQAAFAGAYGRLDAAQDPQLAAAALLYVATAAFSAAPAELPSLARRIDHVAAPDASAAEALRYPRHLVHALAEAAAGNAEGARAQIRAAVDMPHPDDTGEGDLRMVALTVAQRLPSAAADVVGGIDVDACEDAAILRLYSAYARAHGTPEQVRRADARLAALRAETLAAVAGQPLPGAPAEPSLAASEPAPPRS